jgi:hypothetical protein
LKKPHELLAPNFSFCLSSSIYLTWRLAILHGVLHFTGFFVKKTSIFGFFMPLGTVFAIV